MHFTRIIRSITATGFAGMACVACTSLDSEDLRTNGMQPQIVVRSNAQEANSKLIVHIHVGDSITQFVDLDDPDVITVAVNGGAAETLDESNLLGVTSYTKDIPGKEPGTEILVALARGEQDDPAPSSTVTFTEQLTLVSPAAGASLSRADDDILVEWTSEASDDGVRVDVNGDCIQPLTRPVQAGATSITLEKGSIQKREDTDEDDDQTVPDSCDINIAVVRTRTGTLDPAFGGGAIRHEFSASANATSNP